MDEVFINALIQKQTHYVGDLMNKCIILEAKVSVLEKQLAEITAKYEKEQAAKKKTAV